ncbi:MAG: formylglycine-generating enzyme family protein [Candidatus Electrothrix sp. Rat3]|nr:formylglycine-generating enzyme family protein [Candidatus Electrothrix rattekaaiensis]
MIPPDRPFRRSARSRADLLYLLAQHASARHAELADLVGFEPAQRELPAKKQRPFPETDGQAGATEPTPPSIGSTKKPKARFFLVREREAIAPKDRHLERPLDADTGRSLAEREQTGITLGSPPIPADLAPWKRLWPFLRLVLGQAQYGRTLDLRRLIKCISQGEVLRVLPKIPRRSWSTSCQLILDRDLRLLPFWQDFIALADRLSSFRGTAGMEILVFEQGPNGPCRQYEPGKRFPLQHYRRPVAGTPILVLGDLGLLPGGQKKAWMSFGRLLRSAGLEPVALVPCPERYWSRRTARLFSMYVWDIERRFPAKPMQRMRKKGGSGEEAEAQVDQLLDLLAPATHLEPALIRAVRCLLSSEPMDVGCEIAAWLHQDVYPTPLGALWNPEAMHRRRERFRALPSDKKVAVSKLLQALHKYLPQAEQAAEELILAELEGKSALAEQAQQFFWDLVATQDDPQGFSRLNQLESWVRRKQGDMHPAIWQSALADPLSAVVARMASKRVEVGQDPELPEGFDCNKVLWALQGAGQEKRYRLMQRLEPLELEPDSGPAQGSPLGVLHLDSMQFQWQHEDEQGRQGGLHLRNTEHLDSIPVPKSGLLHIQGSQERLTVEGITLPKWAKRIRRDQKGLGLCLSSGSDTADLYWLPPQEYPLRDKQGGSLGSFAIKKGCWMREDEFDEIREQGFRQPSWAEHIGEDQYGLYADLVFKGVTQRFRWVQPGRFMMGSPDNEPKRWEKEGPQHEVILTESYWLADTACPQALWKAVTGNNPSRFKGAERPVERVSWEDVQKFMVQLNKENPGLELDLPSEAQWEYACRAGTSTPFSFGADITPEHVNYDGNFPYADGEKGEYREETVDVKDLPCNDWGLYQMHGNVWEWCRDWFGDYSDEIAIDPAGPSEGRDRVCRGGSWFLIARYCRSAYRSWFEPGYRINWFGFRLARGRTSKQ